MSCCALAVRSVCPLCPRPRGRIHCGQTSADKPRGNYFSIDSQSLAKTSNAVVLHADWAAHLFCSFCHHKYHMDFGLGVSKARSICSGESIQYALHGTSALAAHAHGASTFREEIDETGIVSRACPTGKQRGQACASPSVSMPQEPKQNEIMTVPHLPSECQRLGTPRLADRPAEGRGHGSG